METACAPFFICKRTRFYSSLFTFPSETPVFIGIPRGEEFAATLHPLFTTLHRFQRPTGVNCSARPLGVPEGVCHKSGCWRITVDHRMHITCCACAYQLLCKRTTAVVRPKIQTASTTYPISSNNISLLIQQHILALQTTYPSSSNNISLLIQQQEKGES